MTTVKATKAATPAKARKVQSKPSALKRSTTKPKATKVMQKATKVLKKKAPTTCSNFGFVSDLEGVSDMSAMMSSFELKDFGGDDLPMVDGAYACQSFEMSSVQGPDGKRHVEQYMSTDVGNSKHKIRKGQQAYSNSTSGMQKVAIEFQ